MQGKISNAVNGTINICYLDKLFLIDAKHSMTFSETNDNQVKTALYIEGRDDGWHKSSTFMLDV